MGWYKEIIVDVLVAIFILIAVIVEAEWMQYTLIGYTALMLSAKILVYLIDNLTQLLKKKVQTVPVAVIYQIYGVNIAILLLFEWWITAGLWLLIGLISYLTDRKIYNTRIKS